jgi:hypothetical protein
MKLDFSHSTQRAAHNNNNHTTQKQEPQGILLDKYSGFEANITTLQKKPFIFFFVSRGFQSVGYDFRQCASKKLQ